MPMDLLSLVGFSLRGASRRDGQCAGLVKMMTLFTSLPHRCNFLDFGRRPWLVVGVALGEQVVFIAWARLPDRVSQIVVSESVGMMRQSQ